MEQGHDSLYIGETKRPVRLRFNEHLRDALNKSEDTPMGDHFRECHMDVERERNRLFKGNCSPSQHVILSEIAVL